MMRLNFKEYFKLCEVEDGPLGTVIPNSPFGAIPADAGKPNSADDAPIHPSRGDFDLGLPEVPFTSKIVSVTGPGMQKPGQSTWEGRRHNNLIHITFENGQSVYLSHDEKKNRVHGELDSGKIATVILQRRIDDTSRLPSQVQSITVH